jgi:cation-transporting ATPase E
LNKVIEEKVDLLKIESDDSNPSQEEEEVDKRVISKVSKKKKKGPEIILSDDLLSISGDPLFVEKKETYKESRKVVRKDDIVVNRYNPLLEKGLTLDDYEQRKLAGLINVSNGGSTKSIVNIFFTNIISFFNLLVFGIGIWLLTVHSSFSDFIFVIIAAINISLSIYQEIRAKLTIDKLSILAAPTAFVIRDSEEIEITVDEVVLDDIISLSPGKQIPADLILRSGQIEVNESLLTGESDPIIKKDGDSLFSGSFVVSGNAKAQVVSVGKDVYIEKLTAQAKRYKKPKSDLFASLRKIIITVGVIILPLAGLLFWVNYSIGIPYPTIVRTVSAAMIGMIPSGLFLLTTISLGVGVVRLGQHHTMVQELSCIEMLARIDTLCLDKTGTITDGSMSVKSTLEYKSNLDLPLKNIISMMLNAQDDHNMTSEALIERFGLGKKGKVKDLIPFSSTRKYSAVTFDKIGTFFLGAPEYILSKQDYYYIEADVNKQAKEGYRVLCVGYSITEIKNQTFEGLINPIGLIIIEDNIRNDAIETIEYFKQIGVNVKVISGDNPLTVSKIAERSGIVGADKYISLAGMDDKDVIRNACNYNVFGRVSPSQKKILVETLKNNGKCVAMTGDGVNDILALKEADTSIAMASGSEAARNVSHLVLLDSNFSSLPRVVAEGRRVINNIQKVSALFLTKTIFSFFLLIAAIVRKGVYPIIPSQLMLIDFLVTGIPSFILALQANNTIVKGKFLKNVIKGALPGAIVVLINSLIIIAFEKRLGMSSSTISTLVVLTATFTSFGVLFRVSKPFNTLRKALFVLMISLFFILIIFVPNFFSFNPFFEMNITQNNWDSTPLDLSQILLLVVLFEATYPLMFVVSNIYKWIKDFIKGVIKLIANLQD